MDTKSNSVHATHGSCLFEFHCHRLLQILHLVLKHADGQHTTGDADSGIPASEERRLLNQRPADSGVTCVAIEERLGQVHLIIIWTAKSGTVSFIRDVIKVKFYEFKIKTCPRYFERCPGHKV